MEEKLSKGTRVRLEECRFFFFEELIVSIIKEKNGKSFITYISN